VRVHLAAEHALQLEFAHLGFKPLCVVLDVACCAFVVLALGELQQLAGIVDTLGGLVDFLEIGAQPRAFLAELLRALRLGPYGRVLQLP
jgi:hypothetical protein